MRILWSLLFLRFSFLNIIATFGRVSTHIVLTDNESLIIFLGAGSSALKRPFEDGLGDDKDPNKKMKRNLRKST